MTLRAPVSLRSRVWIATFVACLALLLLVAPRSPSPVLLVPAAQVRGGDVTAHVDEDGARFVIGPAAFRMRLAAIGRATDGDLSMAPVASGIVEHASDRVTLDHREGVLEWWRDGSLGVEHGVDLASRPEGPGELVLALELEGDFVPESDGADAIVFRDASGGAVGRYQHLVVLDADGAAVPARMASAEGAIHLLIDDSRARYPLIVDPLIVRQEAILTTSTATHEFGTRIALTPAGDRLVVTAGNAGVVHIYARSEVAWSRESTVAPATPTTGPFGLAIAISASGTRALASTSGDTVGSAMDAGRVRVLERSGSTWSEVAILSASDAASGDVFGESVALSAAGTSALIGVPGDEGGRGSGRIFTRTPPWVAQATLTTSDGAPGDALGISAALSADGALAVLGAPFDDHGGRTDAGSVRTFRFDGTVWNRDPTLTAPSPADNDQFGIAIGLSADGTRMVVGAPQRSVAGPGGSAMVFLRSGTSWMLEAELAPPARVNNAQLGATVAISADGSMALVGAPGVGVGVVHAFRRMGTAWSHQNNVAPVDAVAGDGWGRALALSTDGARAALGGAFDVVGGLSTAGSVRVLTLAAQRALGASCTANDECTSSFCADGFCCNAACAGGTSDCMACSVAAGAAVDGTCGPLGPVMAPTVICRAAAAGGCDIAEVCVSGSTTCPADVFVAAGSVCRPASGDACDVAETCTGASVSCPANLPAVASTICRASAGSCDAAELCDGTSFVCPGDVYLPDGTACGMGIGDCGFPANCTGLAPGCPSLSARPAGTVCREAAGLCDISEICDGVAITCPADVNVAAGVECAASSGEACDAPDVCDGSSPICLPAFLSGVECRASSGGCDPAEICLGSDTTCPPDQTAPSGTVCRASTDLLCDPLESCDGAGAACPADENTCEMPDGGMTAADASTDADVGAGADAGPPVAATGCACRSSAVGSPRATSLLLPLAVVWALRRRRRVSRSRV